MSGEYHKPDSVIIDDPALRALDLTPEPEPMYVIVQHAPNAPGRFKRRLDAVQPLDDLESAQERAGLLERMAHECGRRNDTYRVYELREVTQ